MTNNVDTRGGPVPGARPVQEWAKNSQNIRRPVDLRRTEGAQADASARAASSLLSSDGSFAGILSRLSNGLTSSLSAGVSNLMPFSQRSQLLPPRKVASQSAGQGAARNIDTAAVQDLPYANLLIPTARKHGVSPELAAAVIKAESGFNPRAQSHAGAKGLMQLMDGTARSLGVSDVFDPGQNLDGGIRFLSSLLKRYDGNTSLALAAYNAGPGAVEKYGGIPPYKETRDYVARVLNYWKGFGGSPLASDLV